MKRPLCDLLGIESPLFAFSHCRDVVAAVSSAGGFGVLGPSIKSSRTVVREFMEEFAGAALHLGELVAE